MPENEGTLTSPELEQLYTLYQEFMDRLGQERGQTYPVASLEDFSGWLMGLDPETRQLCEQDYRRGYDEVIRDREEQVSKAISRFRVG